MAKKTRVNQIELYFEWWLTELMEAGNIKEWSREPETMTVVSESTYGRIKRFKRKENEIEQFNLFHSIDYTYDYFIIWNTVAEYLFYEVTDETNVFQFGKPLFVAHEIVGAENGTYDIGSYVDVKPTTSVMQRGGKVSSAVSFPIKQRMIWDNYRKYINKVVPMPMAGTGFKSALFIKSFTPKRYLITDGGQQARKIKWPTTMLKQYVNDKVTNMNTILKTTS